MVVTLKKNNPPFCFILMLFTVFDWLIIMICPSGSDFSKYFHAGCLQDLIEVPNSEVWVEENQAPLSRVKLLLVESRCSLHLPNLITTESLQIGKENARFQNSLINPLKKVASTIQNVLDPTS